MLLTDGDGHLPLALRDEPLAPAAGGTSVPWTMALYSAARWRFLRSKHGSRQLPRGSGRKLPRTWGAMHAHDRLLYNHQRRRRGSRRRPSRD